MHISVYTRHCSSCPKRDDTRWRRCKCPKWHYSAEWKPAQRSAKTRSWEEAERRAREIEVGNIEPQSVSIPDSVKLYLSDMKDRNLSGDYQKKVKRELDGLVEWCRVKPVRSLADLGLAELGEWRRTWRGNATTRSKRQERLRSYLLYCVRHGWLKESPAAGLSKIKTDTKPTIPLTKQQFAKCLELATPRTRAMLLLLRYSGLRITDAATLERGKLENGKLFLYTQKTGTPVRLPLPPRVIKELSSLKGKNPRYFFWSGETLRKSAGVRWWENLKLVFRSAGLPDAHPHSIRDTFAVEMLLSGVPLEQVSVLLGHSSIRVTEKHYSPWVKARQDQLEESVKRSWAV